MNTKETNYIILRKTPYKESSLILAGITDRFGRIDLLVKGAKKGSSKQLPAIDIFREIAVRINPEKTGLIPIYSAELVASFDSLASRSSAYFEACDISRFILRNSQPSIPMPDTYNAVKTALSKLTEKDQKGWAFLVKLTLLKEHGLLPENSENERQKEELLEKLLSAAQGTSPLPDISKDYIQQLSEWVDALCKYHELTG